MDDHQPPVFAKADKGTEVPVHIICKNPIFLSEWLEKGFKSGLVPDKTASIFAMEGLYSLFRRAFFSTFGNNSILPEYEPKGKKIIHG